MTSTLTYHYRSCLQSVDDYILLVSCFKFSMAWALGIFMSYHNDFYFSRYKSTQKYLLFETYLANAILACQIFCRGTKHICIIFLTNGVENLQTFNHFCFMGKVFFQKSKMCGPPPLMGQTGDTTIAAISAQRRLLSKTYDSHICQQI